MVITNILGGLGNQMFQYAAGRSLSLRHTTDLYLDTTRFRRYNLHQGFELDSVFDLNYKFLCQKEVNEYLGSGTYNRTRRIQKILGFHPAFQLKVFSEPHFHYYDGWNSLSEDTFLQGHWQSERYFSEYMETIRSDFKFKQVLDSKSLSIVEKISASTAVALHVRRGDYASSNYTNAFHGLCSPKYYADAIDYLHQRVDNMNLFIFSDDIDWVRAYIPLAKHDHTFVSHNIGKNSWRDMNLMSLCKHNIIANSSFSWWGAWLNPNKSKIVLRPKEWFSDGAIDTSDITPETWRII